MAEVILVRPGHTDFDEQNRIQGLLDLPLSERGRRHIDEVAARLEPLKINVILCDPGEPAYTTAEQLGDALKVPVKEKEELRNLDQGLWQGLQLDEVRRKYPKLIKQWHEHPETICPPEGEPVCEAMRRIQDALKKPLKKYGRVVIVAADPLATLIAGMLRGAKPEFHGPMCSHTGCCVEHFSNDPAPCLPMSNGVSTVNGVPVNGVQTVNGNGHAPVYQTTVSAEPAPADFATWP